MKVSNLIKTFAAIVLTSFLLYSCKDNTNLLSQKAVQSDHFISGSMAKKIAGNLIFNKDPKTLKSQQSSVSEKQVKSVFPVPDENSNTVFYIINYEGGGFVILSADNRVMPISAYSDKNSFPIGSKSYPVV